MNKTLYEYTNYKEYLLDWAKASPRGFRLSLAEATHCHTAYVSQVLGGPKHFNMEQSEAAGRFLNLNRDEIRYFLVLVEFARAGTESLRSLLSEQLNDLRKRALVLKKQVKIHDTLSRENQTIYYSSWHYAAVHMAVTIPSLQEKKKLEKALRLSARKLGEVVSFLKQVGLVKVTADKIEPGTVLLHLENDSPLIFQHHTNWRLRSLDSLGERHVGETVHYSSVVTLSAEDAVRLKAKMTHDLTEWLKTVQQSKEEQLFGLTLDFFRVDST